jgi:hypothetical protein
VAPGVSRRSGQQPDSHRRSSCTRSLVATVAALMTLAAQRVQLTWRCPIRAAGSGLWLAAAGSAETMNVFAASHLQAAGLARLIAATPGRARLQLTPAAMGIG